MQANEEGIRGVVLRLPLFVYAKGYSFFYNVMYKAAEKKGSASYVGAGNNKLCVVHADNAARAFVALLSHKDAHGVYNVPGENGITAKDIAEIIVSKLNCKAESVSAAEAQQLFGPAIAMRMSVNAQADGIKVQRDLGWTPQHTNFRQEI